MTLGKLKCLQAHTKNIASMGHIVYYCKSQRVRNPPKFANLLRFSLSIFSLIFEPWNLEFYLCIKLLIS